MRSLFGAFFLCASLSYGGFGPGLSVLTPSTACISTLVLEAPDADLPGFVSYRSRDAQARSFARLLGYSVANPLHPDDYSRMARAFAGDDIDSRIATLEVSVNGAKTLIKVHEETNELLVSRDGKIGTYCRLGFRRPIGAMQSISELARWLSIPPRRRPHEVRLSSGRDLGQLNFQNYHERRNHFVKHVLSFKSKNMGIGKIRRSHFDHTRNSHFPVLRRALLDEAPKQSTAEITQVLLEKYARLYEAEAQRFARSTDPSVLSIVRWNQSHSGTWNVTIHKFNPLTSEYLIAIPDQKGIATYFRIDSMDAANEQLKAMGYGPVSSPLEYFLAQATWPEPQLP